MMHEQLDLANVKPSETGGPRASNRLDFQKNWTLCHLVERHKEGADYVVVCDYHDDVVVLIGVPSAAKLHFYQVKTRDGSHWTMARLTSSKKKRKKKGKASAETAKLADDVVDTSTADEEEGGSILGKLYKHKLGFLDRLGSLNLVSNCCFKLSLSDGTSSESKPHFTFVELDVDEKKAAAERVQAEHNLTEQAEFPEATHFIVSDMTTTGHDKSAIGVIATYLEYRYGTSESFPVAAIHRSLFDEIRRRSNREGTWDDLDLLLKQKGVSRSDFEKLLSKVHPRRDAESQWLELSKELESAGISIRRRIRISNSWHRYRVDRIDESNEILQRRRDAVVAVIEKMIADGIEDVSTVLSEVSVKIPADQAFDPEYTCAMALYEFCNIEDPVVQKTHSQPPEEAP
ncbi:DUF4297 domain-containing protein [Myxococcus sp. AM010]|uniref:DUF4297 domain-containing protein n=1 Tax=Myxococcus sp. AM010 TaxID=2745138 RepID=UPI001595BA0D|nr:DUF4297 domain-containing protein [Myxococcus sp. AM010]NVJ17472.1 DUF4297 domain-containing protein [Myxococcus sp. AM010]